MPNVKLIGGGERCALSFFPELGGSAAGRTSIRYYLSSDKLPIRTYCGNPARPVGGLTTWQKRMIRLGRAAHCSALLCCRALLCVLQCAAVCFCVLLCAAGDCCVLCVLLSHVVTTTCLIPKSRRRERIVRW